MRSKRKRAYNKSDIEEIIRNMTPMSDIMTKAIFKDRACVEYLVRTLMNDENLIIVNFNIQYNIPSLKKHSVTLDIYAIDGNGRAINIEIQCDNENADVHRARYNSSLIDTELLPKGANYKDLPDKYVFFVTLHDYFGLGRQIYSFENTMSENGKVILKLNDGAHIIYVNAQAQDDTALGRLLHDLCCKNSKDMYNKTLADRFDFVKNDSNERKEIDMTVDQIMEQIAETYSQEAVRENREEIAEALILKGKIPLEDIAECTKLNLEEVEMIAKELRED